MDVYISNHGRKCLTTKLLQFEQCDVMFKVISEKSHIDMKFEIQLLLQIVCTGMKMIRALMFIISYYNKIKYLSNLLQLEPCYVMFKIILIIMAHWYDWWNTIIIAINFSNGKK